MQNYKNHQNNAFLTIDLSAIEKNLETLTKKVHHVMPMVKANAYGTDALKLAKFYQTKNVPLIGVSHTREAIALREKGIKLPIFVISVPPFEAELASEYDLDASVSSFEEAKSLEQQGQKKNQKLRVHLCVDTGMKRFGVPYAKALDLANFILSSSFLHLEGIMTHFACADRPDLDSFTYEQISLFKKVVERLPLKPKWIHAANSSGALRFDLPFCNLARVGLALFGMGSNLKQSLRLESHLVSISDANKGEYVGYDCHYLIPRDGFRVGVVPIGYHDGLHRHFSSKGFVWIRGKKASMIGNICMDFMMIDLTNIPEASISDPVILFNAADTTPHEFAAWGGTEVRQLLSCLGPRVKRVFIKKATLESIQFQMTHFDRATAPKLNDHK